MTTLYLDGDVRVDTAAYLEAAGYAVHTTARLGRVGALDPDQLHYAVQRGWTLVTHNRKDFPLLHLAWTTWGLQPAHAGILALTHGPPSVAIAGAIDALLNTSPALSDILYNWTEPDNTWRVCTPERRRA